MSKPESKPVPLAPTDETAVPLEAAMERLDAIVREMENGDLPIETLITRYEEGIALSKLCRDQLDRAEERIRIISRDAAGNPVLEDFETNSEE